MRRQTYDSNASFQDLLNIFISSLEDVVTSFFILSERAAREPQVRLSTWMLLKTTTMRSWNYCIWIEFKMIVIFFSDVARAVMLLQSRGLAQCHRLRGPSGAIGESFPSRDDGWLIK